MSWFDFTLKHVAGSKIGKVDGLIRRADWKVGVEKYNKTKYLLRTTGFAICMK